MQRDGTGREITVSGGVLRRKGRLGEWLWSETWVEEIRRV